MQTKYKLGRCKYNQACGMVKLYRDLVNRQHEMELDICYATPNEDGMPHGTDVGMPTESKALRLIEKEIVSYQVAVVDEAKEHIGENITDETQRQKLRNAIIESCIAGRKFTFEYCNLYMSRRSFFREKQQFLYRIAVKMCWI